MRKGFTLVELLIVLAVIAALMAVATPLALNAVRTAKASQVAQNLTNIKSAFENYFNVEKPANPTSVNLTSLVPNYLSSAPTGYALGVTAAATPGVFNVTVSYTGGDVELVQVQKNGLPNAGGTNNNIQLTIRVQKWW